MANTWFASGCDKANPGWPCDPELEPMITAWSMESDPAKRYEWVEKIQARGYVSVPYIPYGQFFQPVAFRSNIKGVLESGMPVYWNIEKQ